MSYACPSTTAAHITELSPETERSTRSSGRRETGHQGHNNNIYPRHSSPPPPHRLQCSGSQDSFTVDHYCAGDPQSGAAGTGAGAGAGSGAGAGVGPGAGGGAGAGSGAGQWSGGGGGGVGVGGVTIGMCQHHGLTSQSLMSGGSHMSLLGSSGSSGMSGSGVGSSGQGVPVPQCPAAAAAAEAALGGHCRSLSGLSSISIPPPPALFNPCSSAISLQQAAAAAASRWGPRTSCPVHSPFRVRVPNGSICSGHQVRSISRSGDQIKQNQRDKVRLPPNQSISRLKSVD